MADSQNNRAGAGLSEGPKRNFIVEGDASVQLPDRLYLRSEEDLDRLEFGGGLMRGFGREVEVVPRISRADYEIFKTMDHPTVSEMLEPLVAQIPGLSETDADAFVRSRRVVMAQMPNGISKTYVVPDIWRPGPLEGPLERQRAVKARPEPGARPWRATLAQVLTDAAIRSKFELSGRVWNTILRLCVSQPAAAAKIAQEAIQRARPDLRVAIQHKGFGLTKSAAQNSIRLLCHALPDPMGSTPADLADGKIFVHLPEELGPTFTVCGPTNYTREVHAVFKLALHLSPGDAAFLLSYDTQLLGIDIHTPKGCESGQLEQHVLTCDSDSESYGLPMELPSIVSECPLPVNALQAVRDGSGRVVATAIQVTTNRCVINAHVFGCYAEVYLGGKPVVRSSALGQDAWAAVNDVVFPDPWKVRDAEVGEYVFVVAHTLGGENRSTIMQVQGFGRDTIRTTLSRVLTRGWSGGALVAVKDGALLGIHSGTTNFGAVAAKFGATEFTALMSEVLPVDQRVGAQGTEKECVYGQFRSRGLGPLFRGALNSMTPLYNGDNHVGMSVYDGQEVYTTLLPGEFSRCGEVPVTVEVAQGLGGKRSVLVPVEPALVIETVAPSLTRPPEKGEAIVVVGRDRQGPYVSEACKVLTVRNGQREYFHATAISSSLPVAGGYVVALRDAAVVGIYSHSMAAVQSGTVAVCLPYELRRPRVDPAKDIRSWMRHKYPYLNVDLVTDETFAEVMDHTSCQMHEDGTPVGHGNRPLAALGDAVMRVVLYSAYLKAGVDNALWNARVQQLQCNVAQARATWQHGLADFVRVGKGVELDPSSKAYADVYEALVGALTGVNTFEALSRFMFATGTADVLLEPSVDMA